MLGGCELRRQWSHTTPGGRYLWWQGEGTASIFYIQCSIWKGKIREHDKCMGMFTCNKKGSQTIKRKRQNLYKTGTWLLPSFSEVSRPTRPGSLWWKLCIALKRWVTSRAPRRTASSPWDNYSFSLVLPFPIKHKKMTGETPEVNSDKRKPRMHLRHRIS